MILLRLLLCGLTLSLLSTQLTFAQSFFTARMSSAQEVHDVAQEASGTAALVMTEEGLRFFLTVEGLSGEISAAHFHNAPAGVDGPVVRDITDAFDGNTATGIWTSTDGSPLTE